MLTVALLLRHVSINTNSQQFTQLTLKTLEGEGIAQLKIQKLYVGQYEVAMRHVLLCLKLLLFSFMCAVYVE